LKGLMIASIFFMGSSLPRAVRDAPDMPMAAGGHMIGKSGG